MHRAGRCSVSVLVSAGPHGACRHPHVFSQPPAPLRTSIVSRPALTSPLSAAATFWARSVSSSSGGLSPDEGIGTSSGGTAPSEGSTEVTASPNASSRSRPVRAWQHVAHTPRLRPTAVATRMSLLVGDVLHREDVRVREIVCSEALRCVEQLLRCACASNGRTCIERAPRESIHLKTKVTAKHCNFSHFLLFLAVPESSRLATKMWLYLTASALGVALFYSAGTGLANWARVAGIPPRIPRARLRLARYSGLRLLRSPSSLPVLPVEYGACGALAFWAGG